jgi:hypothetical protein
LLSQITLFSLHKRVKSLEPALAHRPTWVNTVNGADKLANFILADLMIWAVFPYFPLQARPESFRLFPARQPGEC